MRQNTKTYLIIGILALAVFLPRLALLTSGLDSQRLWDTNTTAAFSWLSAAKNNELGSFYTTIQKYPLLGSYLHIPTVVAYAVFGQLFGAFSSPSDFIDAYVVGETHLFFWIRLEMLLVNLASLALLYCLAKRFTNRSMRAGIYTLLFAGVNFFVTLFSVQPRIHSLAFLGTTITLYTSFLLLEKKTRRRYLLAFGSAAIAGSLSQSGLLTVIVPILAHFFDGQKIERRRIRSKELWLGLLVFAAGIIILGYPQMITFLLTERSLPIREVFLSSEHTPVAFSFGNLFRFAKRYFLVSEFASLWMVLVYAWYLFASRRKDRLHLEPVDYLAMAHVLLFFLVFGFSNVLTGRFTLAVLPSLFFLFARALLQLEKKKIVLYPLAFVLAVQAYSIGQLTSIAFHGDTRTVAAQYMLSHTNENDHILSTVDPIMLGVTPAPHSIQRGDTGAAGKAEAIIAERDILGSKSRQYTLWDPANGRVTDETLKSFRYVVVSADHPERYRAEDMLNRNGFTPIETISARHDGDTRDKATIPWDMVAPYPHVPLPLALRSFRSFGPTIVIYEKK